MFELNYRIVHNEYDDFVGQYGFLQIKCNDYNYGEIYSREIEAVMDKVSLYDWFERLARVTKSLVTKEYVALSDVESYNTWIEFKKKNEEIVVSIIKAKKKQGSRDIEFELNEQKPGEWTNQIINFNQFKKEVIKKGMEYIEYISASNTENIMIDKIKQEFLGIM